MAIKRRPSDVSDLDDDGCCRVDPTTPAGRRLQTLQLVGLPLLPSAGLLIYLLVQMANSVKDIIENNSLRHVLDVSEGLAGSVLKDLQTEAAGTIAYVGLNGTGLFGTPSQIYIRTDASLADLSWPENGIGAYSTKRSFMQTLTKHRRTLRVGPQYAHLQVEFYWSLVLSLTEWLTSSIFDSAVEGTLLPLFAFSDLVYSVDELTLQKVLGVLYYITGTIDRSMHNAYLQSEKRGFDFLERAKFIHDPVQLMYAKFVLANTDFKEFLGLFLVELQSGKPLTPDPYKVIAWNGRMDYILETIGNIQRDIIPEVRITLDAAKETAVNNVAYNVIICMILLSLFTPFIVNNARRTTTNLQMYAAITINNNRELRHEKRKSEKLLTEMLPRSVAERLRVGQTVGAETYQAVTVFFSDIPDFTDISKKSAPMEIVVFLNEVYRFMDVHIERYDVYKVETIGCVYMVVSGLPNRNGKRHSTEIGRMSLDLLENVEDFIIPQMRDRRLHLRIGVCSGSCVAGVVGLRAPRYCLFGDTVNTAARMQTNGQSDKIHISASTYELLSQAKGFKMKHRGVVEIKGKGKMETYWLLSRDTGSFGSNKSLTASSRQHMSDDSSMLGWTSPAT